MPDKPDLEAVLQELKNSATSMIASPETIATLRGMGIPMQDEPERTWEKRVTELFEKRRESAVARAEALPPPPDRSIPFILTLYQEIAECIIFGLPGAAITLSSILLEFALKYATYIKSVGGFGNFDPEQWDTIIESATMGPAIDNARKEGLIDDDMVGKLKGFKDTIRNPYNHYNVRKITASAVFRKVKQVNVESGQVEERDIAAKDDPVFQAQAKPLVDARLVLPTVTFAMRVTNTLLGKLPK